MLVKPVAYYVENRLNQKMRYCIINPPSRRRGLSLIKMKNLTKTTTIQSAQYAQLLSCLLYTSTQCYATRIGVFYNHASISIEAFNRFPSSITVRNIVKA